jgi:tetratricopeptide (TPR) repeat protein
VCGVLFLVGLTWQAQSIWQRDLTLFQRAVECNPRSAFITLQYVDVLNNAGLKDQADRLFARLRAEQPDHPRVLYRLVRLAIDQGDYDAAMDRSRALIRAAPSLLAYRTLGDLLTLTDQSDAAIEAYRMALSYDPPNMLAITALGNLYEKAQHWDEAVALYQAGLQKHPNAANVWFRLGRVFEHSNRLQEAADAFEQVIRLDRFCSNGYLAEAQVRQKLGEPRSAEEAVKRYTGLTHQAAIPRPTADPLDAPCGNEPKIIYLQKSGAMSLSPGPAQPASP